MRKTKRPSLIYSSLEDLATAVLKMGKAPPASPGSGGETPAEIIARIEESDLIPPGSEKGEESRETSGRLLKSVADDLAGAAAETRAAATESGKRFLRRRVAAKDLCPGCNQDILWRVQRNGWMRLLPESRHLMCDTYEARFLTFCGWTVRLA